MCLLRGTDLIFNHHSEFFSLLTIQTRCLCCSESQTARFKLVKCPYEGLGLYVKTARMIVSYKVSCTLFTLSSLFFYLRLLSRLLVPSIYSSSLLSINCLRRQFLCKMWLTQLVFFFRFIVCRMFISSFFRPLVKLVLFSLHQRHTSNFQRISDLFSEVFKVHQHTEPCCMIIRVELIFLSNTTCLF